MVGEHGRRVIFFYVKSPRKPALSATHLFFVDCSKYLSRWSWHRTLASAAPSTWPSGAFMRCCAKRGLSRRTCDVYGQQERELAIDINFDHSSISTRRLIVALGQLQNASSDTLVLDSVARDTAGVARLARIVPPGPKSDSRALALVSPAARCSSPTFRRQAPAPQRAASLCQGCRPSPGCTCACARRVIPSAPPCMCPFPSVLLEWIWMGRAVLGSNLSLPERRGFKAEIDKPSQDCCGGQYQRRALPVFGLKRISSLGK